MRDRVVIPTYDRPEMLALCLEHVFACPEIMAMDVVVSVDRHIDDRQSFLKEIEQVAADYQLGLTFRPEHVFSGNSFNVLMALFEAYVERCDVAFVIEDDVLVDSDFFTWQYSHIGMRIPDPFAAIGGKNTRQQFEFQEGQSDYYDTNDECLCSIGIGYPRSSLLKIIPHINYDYLSDMVGYCKRMFPEHTGDPNMAEQDGLIQRIMLREPHEVVWSNPPRAHHCGWYGYHRPNTERPTGTLDERIAQVREIISDPERLKQVAQSDDVEISAFR